MHKAILNSKPTGIYIASILLIICASSSMAEMDTHVPMGWAAVPSSATKPGIDGNDVESTTGGGDGKVVKATSSGELAGFLKSSEPLVIMAEGSFDGTMSIGSNKTIIGAGSGATFKGGFTLVNVSNIIVRNLKVSGGSDAFGFGGAHHVWIDHCDLSACGLIDITNGSDNVTVSWVRFSNHHKTMLINHGKNIQKDVGRLNVTLHHNWHDKSRTRNPRVGFGQVHILNNYYNANGYAIHTYWNAEVVIERCFFKDVGDAVSDHKGSTPGTWPGPGYVVLIDNYTNKPGSIKKETTSDPERIFNVDGVYMYDWVLTKDVQQVPDVVQKGAGTGTEWGKIGAIPTPGQGYTRVSTSPTLKWTKVGSKESNKVFFGKSYPPPEVATVDGYSYKPGNLNEGTVYYWKINDGKVWKFRTMGKPVAVRPSSSSLRDEVSKSVTFQKGEPGQSTLLIGFQKSGNEKHLYDLNGREHRQANTSKSAKSPISR